MATYSGINATIDLTDEVLRLQTRGIGRLTEAQPERRIPLSAIADVQFKDAGMNNGYLHLVLGSNAPVDKPGLLKLANDPDTVVFRVGKQAHGVRELHRCLVDAVARNRRNGVDPSSVPYDKSYSRSEWAAEQDRRALAHIRPDIARASEDLGDLARVMRALQSLPQHLADDEEVLHITTGGYGSIRGQFAVLTVTNQQVLMLQDTVMSQRSDMIPVPRVQGVAYSTGPTGKVEVYSANRSLVLVSPDPEKTAALVTHLRRSLQP